MGVFMAVGLVFLAIAIRGYLTSPNIIMEGIFLNLSVFAVSESFSRCDDYFTSPMALTAVFGAGVVVMLGAGIAAGHICESIAEYAYFDLLIASFQWLAWLCEAAGSSLGLLALGALSVYTLTQCSLKIENLVDNAPKWFS